MSPQRHPWLAASTQKASNFRLTPSLPPNQPAAFPSLMSQPVPAARPKPQSPAPKETVRPSAHLENLLRPAARDPEPAWSPRSPHKEAMDHRANERSMDHRANERSMDHQANERSSPSHFDSRATRSTSSPPERAKPVDEERRDPPTRSQEQAATSRQPNIETARQHQTRRPEAQTIQDPGPDDIAEAEPLLWFLTGQLQHIQPQQIPGLVLNNSFIQQAMSSQDLQQFMGQTKPAQTWMNLLHNGPGPQPDLSQFGIHPETRMSALDFFNRLGFDAQQIMAEMTQLKANLPLEGLHSYMVRAAALNKPAQNPQASAQSGNEQTSSAASPINGDLAKDPAATTTGMTTTGMTTTGMTTTGMTTTGMTTSTEQSGKMSPAQAMAPNPQGVYAQKAGQDPFQAITGRWDPNSVNQVVGPQGPLTPAGQNQQPGIDQQNIMAETQSMTQTTDNPENQPQSFAGPNSGVLGGSGLFKQTNGKNSPATKDPTMLPKLQGEPLPAGLSMNPEGRSRSSSQDEGFSGQRQDQSNASFWANPFQQAGTTRSRDVGQTGFQQQIMSPDLAQARADILQKAQMLVKDGGGSIRIDMGHQDLGKLDLALDLNQQDLELRLVTDSEKARELLSQELPRLKEALQEANINLKSVEIGLRSDNQWSHTDDDGRRHQGQSFHQDEYLEDGPLQVQRSRKFVQHRSIDPARLSQPHANGQIQIRV